MNFSRIGRIFVPAMSGMAVLRARAADVPAPAAMPEQQPAPWQVLIDNPVVGIGIALAVVVALALFLVVLLRKRGSGGRYDYDEGPVTYMGGYERIEPRTQATYRAKNMKAVSDEKTDTIVGPWNVPADFDVPRFLRKCKAYFMRLQASWDSADVKDIRRFTTRELFGEFCKQLNERGKEASMTEVVTLGAELQGVETEGDYYIATVKFTGMVKEDEGEVAPFSEVWNLSKPLDGHRSWVLAKIQQPI